MNVERLWVWLARAVAALLLVAVSVFALGTREARFTYHRQAGVPIPEEYYLNEDALLCTDARNVP